MCQLACVCVVVVVVVCVFLPVCVWPLAAPAHRVARWKKSVCVQHLMGTLVAFRQRRSRRLQQPLARSIFQKSNS